MRTLVGAVVEGVPGAAASIPGLVRFLAGGGRVGVVEGMPAGVGARAAALGGLSPDDVLQRATVDVGLLQYHIRVVQEDLRKADGAAVDAEAALGELQLLAPQGGEEEPEFVADARADAGRARSSANALQAQLTALQEDLRLAEQRKAAAEAASADAVGQGMSFWFLIVLAPNFVIFCVGTVLFRFRCW